MLESVHGFDFQHDDFTSDGDGQWAVAKRNYGWHLHHPGSHANSVSGVRYVQQTSDRNHLRYLTRGNNLLRS